MFGQRKDIFQRSHNPDRINNNNTNCMWYKLYDICCFSDKWRNFSDLYFNQRKQMGFTVQLYA